jgi:hypothetical protein
MHTSTPSTEYVQRVLITLLLLAFAAVVLPAASADAAVAKTGEQKMLSFALSSGADGPELPDGRLLVELPVAAVADRGVLADLDAGARIDRLSVGEPAPQAGPHHDSTTWFWQICVWVTFPDGTSYSWCFALTITVSTDIEGPVFPSGPLKLATATEGVPLKLCWTETLPSGAIAKHCIEITINTGPKQPS